MATLNQIATALRRADEAGDVEAAKRLARAYRDIQSSFFKSFEPPKEKAGFFGSFKEAITSLGLTDEAAAYAANPTEENRKQFLKAAESKYKSVGGFGKGENWEAFKELLGGSLGALAAPIGAAVIGGGLPGFAAASGAQYTIANLQRQAEAQQAAADRGEEVPDLALGKAATAAAAQAGLDVIPGALILKGLRKFPVAQRLLAQDSSAEKAANVLVDAFKNKNLSLKGNVAKGVGLGVAFEIPQEIAQQALERWQAGLPLTDDEAKEEFKQAAIGAAILGGAFGAVGGYSTYRGEQAERQREQTELEESIIGAPPVNTSIPAEFFEQDRLREQAEIEDSLVSAPVEGGIPFDMFETEDEREARLEREAIQELAREEEARLKQSERRQYSARTLREAAEAEALAPKEDEGETYVPPEEDEGDELFGKVDEEERRKSKIRQATEGVLEGYGPTEGGIPYGMLYDYFDPEIQQIKEQTRRLRALNEEQKALYGDMWESSPYLEQFETEDAQIEAQRQADLEQLQQMEAGYTPSFEAPTAAPASTEGVLEGYGPTEGGIPANLLGRLAKKPPVENPREVALEVIKTTPTIKAVAEATGLNQPQAAALMRQFVDEGLLERKGNKFTIVAPKPPTELETADVSGAAVTTTETDTGAGGRGTDLFTLGPPAGELGAPPARTAGLDTAGDVTERVDDRETNVPGALEYESVLEGLGAPTEGGIPAEYFATTRRLGTFTDLKKVVLDIARRKGQVTPADIETAFQTTPEDATAAYNALFRSNAFTKNYNKAVETYKANTDLRTRALDFIRQTGKGNAPDLQKALDISLSEAKALRKALLGSGAVVQKTNVKAAKTTSGSYFVTEGTYTPTQTYRRETGAVEEATPKPEPIKTETITEGEKKRRSIEEAEAKGLIPRGPVRPTWKGATTKGQLAEETRRAFAALEAEQAGAVEGQGTLDLVGGKAPVVRSSVQQKMIDSVLETGRYLIRTGKMSIEEISSVNAELKKREPNFRKLRKQLEKIASRDEEGEVETTEPYFDDTQKTLDEESDFLDTFDYEKYRPLDFKDRRKLRFKKVKGAYLNTPQFKNWFGKSKILDDVGDAATWYIGSPVTDIEEFRTGTAKAIFASPNPNVANEFTSDRKTGGAGVVYPVHIRAEFPFDYENPTHVKNLIDKLLENAGTDAGLRSTILNLKKRLEEGAWQVIEMPMVQRAIKALGHDGFYVNEYRTKNLGVYDPNQIKSAVGNVGTFSREDNRIRFQKARSQTVGMPADNVRTLVSNIISGWRNPPNFIVVQSYLDLPPMEGVDPESNADVLGISIGNDVYIIADNVRTPRDLKATVFHESLGHYGLSRLFGEQLYKTMLDIYNSNRAIQADADAWLEENGATYPESQFTRDERRALAVEEILSELSEAGPIQNMKWRAAFNRVAALIRKFARALGQLVGKNLAYSNTEVADILVQAHNMVISGKTQIVPRYNNIRYMRSTYNKVLTNALRKVQSGAPGATQTILKNNISSLDNIPASLRNFKLSTFSLHHMMQLYEKYAPAYRRLNILVERMAKDATDALLKHQENTFKYQQALRNNPNSIDAFNRLANDINEMQIPLLAEQLDRNGNFLRFAPDQAVIQRMQGIPANSAAYNALSPEDKVLHKAVQDFAALPAEMQNTLADIYTDYRKYSELAFQVKVEQFLNVLPPNIVAAIRNKYQGNRLKYYLPLRREGTYKLTYLDPNGNKVSEFYESAAERNLGKEEAVRKGGTNLKEESVGEQSYEAVRAPTGLLKELSDSVEQALKSRNASPQTIEETKQIIFDTFVDYLPGTSGNDLRQEIGSRATWKFNGVTHYGRLGYIEDVVGIYEKSVPRMIYQINNLKYTMPLEKTREKLREQLTTYANNRGAPQYAGLSELDTDYIQNLKEDADKRIKFAKNPIYSNYVYTLSKANYIYSIALNISSALINTTIIPMMAWPSLAAKYGVADASKAVGQAMAMFFRNSYRDPATGKITFNLNPTFGNGMQNQTAAHMQELAQLHRMLEMRSVTGTSAEQELQQAQNITVPGYEGLSAKVNAAMSYVFRSSERMNREVTALAAYMLARNVDANGQAFNPSRGQTSVGKATEEAIRLNYDVNGATLPETNSRLYQNDIGRIVLTFRTHALNMILNLAFTFNQAVERINANQPNAAQRQVLRTMARKKLLYIFGSTYMLAGIKGLPLFGAAEVLASLLMGDDDEPYDLEQEVLDSVGTLGLNGPINELLNVDIASRTGFYGLLWRDDPKRLAEVGIPVYVLERIAGPTYGLVEAARRGFNDLADGELVRASEALTPAPIRNMIKGMRYGIDGALTRDGLPIVEDVSAYNSMMQILGFAPADLATAQAQRGATYQIGEKLKNRRVSLLTNLYAARKAENVEAVEKAMDDIRSFNESNPAYRITGDTIRKSYGERERRAREAVGAVFQPRSLRVATSEYVADLDEEDGLF